jgi:DNA modification methylase
MNEDFRLMVIDHLQRGEELPAEWARELFPPDKREYELIYYGKEREEDILAETMAVPLQPVSTFGKNGNGWHNMLIFGDNLQALKTLVERKKAGKLCNTDGTPGVRLIYIDPPFATRQEFRGTHDQKAYQDKISGAQFIEFLRKRLILMRELLADDGSIYVHLDIKKMHYLKVIMDEIFKEENGVSEIVWKRINAKGNVQRKWGAVHETILFYAKSNSSYLWNQTLRELDPDYVEEMYRYVEEETGRRYRLGDLTAPASRASKGQIYTWKGYSLSASRCWVYSIDNMQKLEDAGRIVYTKTGYPQFKRYLDENLGEKIPDWWDDINPVTGNEMVNYPTQKPETLLERVITASSKAGDIVLDGFAGSGTTCAVAEKLGRRWIGIDVGKLAIYTVQKRMLNLRADIGNKGKALKANPFTLYNAGLYDFSSLRQLTWTDWRFFALQLFGCKDEPHKIGGLQLDGKLKGASVLVFNFHERPGQRIDRDTVEQIHEAVGKKGGRKFFIIAPRGAFDFQQDYIDLDGVRYYAMRIPYSIINELHSREFTALEQPKDEKAVNATIDSVGFDFIQPPLVQWKVGINALEGNLFNQAYLKIKSFKSRVRLRNEDVYGDLETLSTIMLDFNFDGEVFDLDAVFYGDELKKTEWEARFPYEGLGEKIMVVFLDIHGNEAREVIPREVFGQPKSLASSTKKKGKRKNAS